MYTSLRNQVIAIMQGVDLSQCGYEINLVTNPEYVPDGEMFQTPDAALQWIYDDAHKRGLPYLQIMVMLAFRFDMGNIAYSDKPLIRGFEAKRSSLKMIIHDDVKNNMIWSSDDTGTMGRDSRPKCLAYPSDKPQYEMLDYIRAKDSDWCKVACHMTVLEYETKSTGSSATRDIEDVYTIMDGVRPPNSLPINEFTYDICKCFDFDALKGIDDKTDVSTLSDELLLAILKRGGGEIPRDIYEK